MKFDLYEIRKGVTRFVAEYTNQSYEDASEFNCEMIDWIISCIEKETKEVSSAIDNKKRNYIMQKLAEQEFE
jgi:hypothetical protein